MNHFYDRFTYAMKQIILASASPRRKQLLAQIGITYTVAPSSIEEKMNARLQPKKQAEHLSLQKAKVVAKKYKNAFILAADTLVVQGNDIIGKPSSLQDAKRILRKLSGRLHKVITGFTIIDTETHKIITKSEETTVFMKKLTDKEIAAYVATGEPLGKAGAYAAQERGALFIEKIEGDFFNIVGLPLFALAKALKKFGVTIF